MVRSRQVTILAMAGSVAKSRLLRLACEAIERICEMGDVWSGPACTRPMRGTGPLSEALRAGRQFSQAGLRLGQGEEFAPGTACSSACELRLLYSNEPVLGLEQGRQCVGGRKTGSFRGLTEGPSRVNEAARRYRAPSITNHVMMVRLNALLYFFESHP